MGHTLKTIDLGGGHIEKEEACMSYRCRSCGVQASACNYMLGLCLQVYAPHKPGCRSYVDQIVRSSSSIGANLYEARYAQSRADFISKLEIALKECSETEFWLELLHRKGKSPMNNSSL